MDIACINPLPHCDINRNKIIINIHTSISYDINSPVIQFSTLENEIYKLQLIRDANTKMGLTADETSRRGHCLLAGN